MFHVSKYCLCTLSHSKFDLCYLCPWNKCHSPLFPQTPGRDFIVWMSHLAICLPRRIKKKPIDSRFANKRMVGRKLEMSTRSGSNYLTLSISLYGIHPKWVLRAGTLEGEESILVSDCSGGFETRLYVHSSFAIILMGKRELGFCLVCLPGVS